MRTDHLYDELKRLKKEVARLIEARSIKKGRSVLCQGATVKYTWIKQHATEFAVDAMCRFLQVSRSAYYDWLHRVPRWAKKKIPIFRVFSKAYSRKAWQPTNRLYLNISKCFITVSDSSANGYMALVDYELQLKAA